VTAVLPDLVLSPRQHACLLALGANGRATLGALAAAGARAATVSSLAHLGLVRVRTAGGRGAMIHITGPGRAHILNAVTVERNP